MKVRNILFISFIALLSLTSCTNDDGNPPGEVSLPEIISLTADKTIVQFGGHDPIIITCDATGGELSYTWYVDLGDIIPMNEDRSMVQFTASDCCIGDKLITCTTENNMGSVTDTLSIYINLPQ